MKKNSRCITRRSFIERTGDVAGGMTILRGSAVNGFGDDRSGGKLNTDVVDNGGKKDFTPTPMGAFKDQLKKRSCLVKVHGLLQPGSVTINGKKADWTWELKKRITTILFAAPLSVNKKVVVAIKDAGIFNDACELQKALNLRRQVRQAKRIPGALSDHPFESDRLISEVEPIAIKAIREIENGMFADDQIKKIENILQGADLPPWLHPYSTD